MVADPERIKLVSVPDTPSPVAPPVPVGVPQEPIPFPAKYRKRRSLFKMGLAATVGATLSYALVEPVKQALREQEQANKPSGGEVFNPTAKSGEISSRNTATAPLDEVVRRSKQESTKVGDLAIPLPFRAPEGSKVEYEVTTLGAADNVLMLRGVPKGTVFYAPVEGELSWIKTLQNSGGRNMNIIIRGFELPWSTQFPNHDSKDGIPVTNFPSGIGFRGKDLKVLIPTSKFNTESSGNYTFSSVVHVKTGDPIFEVVDEEILDILGKKTQIDISGEQPQAVTGLIAPSNKALHLGILVENGKALAIAEKP